jgi:hypothetical protein
MTQIRNRAAACLGWLRLGVHLCLLLQESREQARF